MRPPGSQVPTAPTHGANSSAASTAIVPTGQRLSVSAHSAPAYHGRSNASSTASPQSSDTSGNSSDASSRNSSLPALAGPRAPGSRRTNWSSLGANSPRASSGAANNSAPATPIAR